MEPTDRADELRALALRVERLRALDLPTLLGDTTWVGPTPASCTDDLTRFRRLLIEDARRLRLAALSLEALR